MIKIIFFDFDGVILDSMPIRDYGFRKMVEKYPSNLVDEFIKYHRYNAGLSRFHKIKYFYNELLNEEISENKIQEYAEEFSLIMKSKLTDKKYLISETVEFIKNNFNNYIFHIVSGSEQNELRYLCKELGIEQYFNTIYGSPIHKNDLVKSILKDKKYSTEECILIGDSINDYNAAEANDIKFYGYNNIELKSKGSGYLKSFSNDNIYELNWDVE
jgi:HAD superfamily hydrolase (TIGR01549 family)